MIPICVSKHKIHQLCKYRGLRYLELFLFVLFSPLSSGCMSSVFNAVLKKIYNSPSLLTKIYSGFCFEMLLLFTARRSALFRIVRMRKSWRNTFPQQVCYLNKAHFIQLTLYRATFATSPHNKTASFAWYS